MKKSWKKILISPLCIFLRDQFRKLYYIHNEYSRSVKCMKWGAMILAVALLIAFVWASGCANISFGDVKATFGSKPEQQKLIDCFVKKYGDPRTNSGPPRLLELLVTTKVVDDMPADKVLTFNKGTNKIYFWVFYDNFAAGDPMDMKFMYLSTGETVASSTQKAGGDFGAASGAIEKPQGDWPVGKYSITISGKGASQTVTFEIAGGQPVMGELPKCEDGQPSILSNNGSSQHSVSQEGASQQSEVALAPNKGFSGNTLRDIDRKDLTRAGGASNQGGGLDWGGPSCSNGFCTCPSGTWLCNNKCVDLTTDPNNCGGCGIVDSRGCNPNTYTIPKCMPEETRCLNAAENHLECVNLLNNFNHCGACGYACKAGYGCKSGSCAKLMDYDTLYKPA